MRNGPDWNREPWEPLHLPTDSQTQHLQSWACYLSAKPDFLSEFTIFVTDNPSFSSNQLSSTLTLLSFSSPCHFCSLLTQHLLKFSLSLPLSSPDTGSSYIVETGLELTLWSPSGCGLPLLHAIILNYCTRSATLPTQSFYLVLGSLASLLTQKHRGASWPALLGRIPISPYVLN